MRSWVSSPGSDGEGRGGCSALFAARRDDESSLWSRDLAQQRRAPRTDGQQSAEEYDGIDAFAVLRRPVGRGIEVEPDGKLVKGKRGPDTIGDGEQSTEEDGAGSVPGSGLGKGGIAAEQK